MGYGPKRDHFVARFFIWQFVNASGRVFCFDKQQCVIPDRAIGNRPNEILNRRHFYNNTVTRIDDELYKPIENAFAPWLTQVVRDPKAALSIPACGTSFVNWVASQQTRTPIVSDILKEILRHHGGQALLDNAVALEAELDAARRGRFLDLRAVVTAKRWHWNAFDVPADEGFVLGDHPICHQPGKSETGFMLWVPLSPTTLLVGGSERGLAMFKANQVIRYVNSQIAAWSERFVYSPSLVVLDKLALEFRKTGDAEHDNWVVHARMPYHGLALKVPGPVPADLKEFSLLRDFI